MDETREFSVIAFPAGARTVVATVFRKTAAEVVEGPAVVQAWTRDEYVDVVDDAGRCIATVAPDGACMCESAQGGKD